MIERPLDEKHRGAMMTIARRGELLRCSVKICGVVKGSGAS